MSALTLNHEADVVAQAAQRISTAADYDRLIELAGAAQFVLIGEASHGTHDLRDRGYLPAGNRAGEPLL